MGGFRDILRWKLKESRAVWLQFLREHEVLPWRRLPMMVPAGDRIHRLPDGQTSMPLAFSLRAWKPRRSWR